jgi:uncharacterized membrane protein YkoI
LFGGILLGGLPGRAAAAPAVQTTDSCVEDDDSAESADTEDVDSVDEQCGSQDENEADEANAGQEAEDGNEAVDTGDAVAPGDLGITAVEAQAIVEKANPNTTTLDVEFDREGGSDIWEVELDNGMDVKVDANSGQILLTETRD